MKEIDKILDIIDGMIEPNDVDSYHHFKDLLTSYSDQLANGIMWKSCTESEAWNALAQFCAAEAAGGIDHPQLFSVD